MRDYITVQLPKEIGDLIDNAIENSREGYSSRAEYVKTAVREKVDRKAQKVEA